MPPNGPASIQYYRHLPAPTVVPAVYFNAEDDADTLKKAMKGFGCDEKAVLEILCARSNDQRQQIKHAYKQKYGSDLVRDIKSELKGDLEDLIVALLTKPNEYDASELHKAMKGLGTDESVLIEILLTRSNAEIAAIKKAYMELYEKDLEKAVAGDTSSHFKNFLAALCKGSRDEGYHVDEHKAVEQANQLKKNGIKKLGHDQCSLDGILSTQNFQQIKALDKAYHQVANQDLDDVVEKELGGDNRDCLSAALQVAKGKEKFFVRKLANAMKGLGTDDKTLIRILVSRSERDLLTICQEWERQHANSLENAITNETSGKYKTALLTLIKGGK